MSKYGNGHIMRCIRPTPGLKIDAYYQVAQVVDHLIMGPLFRLRDLKEGGIVPEAYYPWRFEFVDQQDV
mgnify:CR=1 FL=1